VTTLATKGTTDSVSDSTADRGTERLVPLRGFARANTSRSQMLELTDPDQVVAALAGQRARGVLARGGGCSYGDAALNAGGLVLRGVGGREVEVDPDAQTVRAGAAATFADVLTASAPHGLIPAVLPGTRHLTVGGAVAADVHGKNHHLDGSLGSWLQSFRLVTGDGQVRPVDRDTDADLFAATVGGMGLTGVLTEAVLRLRRIPGLDLDVVSTREPDLDAVLARLEGTDSPYAVGWVDGTATGSALGRGVVDLGEHANQTHPPVYQAPRAPIAPSAPANVVTHLSAAALNTALYRRVPIRRPGRVGFSAFFHRLDALSGWNRAIGPAGFLQYQFVVPTRSAGVLQEALERLTRAQAPVFLGTIKRFGAGNGSPLSFPIDGWCLALDIALGRAGSTLAPVLDRIDQAVAEGGGRVYLAKDSRLSQDTFRTMYPQWSQLIRTRDRVDPDGIFRSDLGRRLGLCR